MTKARRSTGRTSVRKSGTEQVIDYRQVGASGLRRFAGFIYEQFLPELTGWKGMAVYKEMSENDATVGAILNVIDKLVRKVPWHVHAASDEPFDVEAKEFLESCMNDMENTWIDTVAEFLSMLPYGFSVHEIVYKRRCGDGFDPSMRSKYSDGRVGWRGLPIRCQDTIYRWQFDDHGGIQGCEQLAPPHYYHVTIPIEKMLLFRTTTHKNNPEGQSIFRAAYRAWYMKKNIENIEAIGIERDLAGLPVAWVPAELLSKDASPEQKALADSIRQIITNVRRDEQEGLMLPMDYDAVSGKPLYDFKLMSTGGTRQMDVDKVINRYDQRIAMTSLADFLFIGHQQTGSWSLVSSRRELFASALGAYLDIIAEVLNNYAVPRLFALNDFRCSEYPKFVHGDLDNVDLEVLAKYLQALGAAGMPLFPDEELEKYLRKVAHLPEMTSPLANPEMQVHPNDREQPTNIREIPDTAVQVPTGLDIPADTTPANGQPKPQTVVTNVSGNTEITGGTLGRRNQSPSQFTDWRKW